MEIGMGTILFFYTVPIIFTVSVFILDPINTVYGFVGKVWLKNLLFTKVKTGEAIELGMKKFIYRCSPAIILGIFMFVDRFKPINEIWIISLFSLILGIALLLLNWRRTGLNIYAGGCILNELVRVLNNGKMPLLGEYGGTEVVRLALFSDRIPVDDRMASAGDILILIGLFIFLLVQISLFVDNLQRNKQ